MLSLCLFLLPSCASLSSSTDLEKVRAVYPDVRMMLEIGTSLAVRNEVVSPEEGQRILDALDAAQRSLDAGAGQSDLQGVLALGHGLLDAMERSGRFEGSDIAAARALLRLLAHRLGA